MSLTSERSAHQLIRNAIQRVAVGPDRGRDISRDEARQIGLYILRGEVDPIQAAVFLIALRMKRESLDEFLGLFDGIQQSIVPLTATVEQLYCLADPFDGFSRTATVTPFLAPVLAACGMPALMHGVESVGPKYGVTAHQVYRLAGINTGLKPAEVVSAIDRTGWGYIDQASYAPQLYCLRELRDRMVKRTALTTLERLMMPLHGRRATHIVLGFVHKAYREIYATVAAQAGYTSILLFKGVEGGLAPAVNKPLRHYLVEAEILEKELGDTGFVEKKRAAGIEEHKHLIEPSATFDNIDAAPKICDNHDAAVDQCLDQGLGILSGQSGLARDSLTLAAAHIVYGHGLANSFPAAVVKVQNSLDNGSAKARFTQLIER